MKNGDRVEIGPTTSLAQRYVGQKGSIHKMLPNDDGALVNLDAEPGRARFFYFSTLKELTTMTIKATVTDAIKKLFPKTGSDKDAVVREYLVANTAASAADSRKKKAKASLISEGLVQSEYRPGDVEAYRSDAFVLNAKTKEPSSRLDQDLLRAELKKAGLSQAKITNAIAAATVENKPATSYEVIER